MAFDSDPLRCIVQIRKHFRTEHVTGYGTRMKLPGTRWPSLPLRGEGVGGGGDSIDREQGDEVHPVMLSIPLLGTSSS